MKVKSYEGRLQKYGHWKKEETDMI